MKVKIGTAILIFGVVALVAAFVQFYVAIWAGSNTTGGSGFVTLVLGFITTLVGAFLRDEDA